MRNTESAKTLTASLPQDAQTLFAWIADPENLPRWHTSFCRSLHRREGSYVAESPRGPIPTRFIRDDHSLVVDILTEVSEGIELTNAIRVLPNGAGAELIWTLVKPEGVSDSIFNEQVRWAGSALQNLRKIRDTSPVERPSEPVVTSSPEATAPSAESTDPSAESSSTPESSEPQSGKKLFIGNLSYAWTDEELRAHFAEQGTVALAEIARFRGRGGRSRGFGFVEMATEAEAQVAIEKLHGGTAGGRQIIVRLAKSQENRQAPAAAETSDTVQPSSVQTAGEVPASRQPRPPARGRSRRLPSGGRGAPPRSGGRARPSEPRQSYNSGVDFVNKSGYEIFPRRSPGSSTPNAPPSAPSRSNMEASPYMDDTGDIENHGRRPPSRHRRRRS